MNVHHGLLPSVVAPAGPAGPINGAYRSSAPPQFVTADLGEGHQGARSRTHEPHSAPAHLIGSGAASDAGARPCCSAIVERAVLLNDDRMVVFR